MKTDQSKLHWLVSSVAAVALLPVCARADTAAAPAADAQPQSSSVGEVLVTAQRRSQRLQDVPISVTAVNAKMLANANVTNSQDLSMVTPGLRITAGGVFIQPTIRGVTTYNDAPNVDANIATYVDGVYQQATLAAYYNLPDVQEVEVLKGPQGTLFGRNATGGAILINTMSPSLTHMTGSFTVGGGNFGNYYGKGFISIPIIQDKLAASLALYREHTDGWITDILSGRRFSPIDSLVARAKVRFDPWEGADFVLEGSYSHVSDYSSLKDSNLNGNNIQTTIFPCNPPGVPAPGCVTQSQVASKPWTYSSLINPYLRPTVESVSLHGNIRLGPGTLTTTTAFSYNYTYLDSDIGNAPGPYSFIYFQPENHKTIQQEFVYSTDKLGRFQDTSGVFLYSNEIKFGLNLNNNNLDIYNLDKTTAFGVFTDGTYQFTDQFSLEAGVRFSWEHHAAYATIGGTAFGQTQEQASAFPQNMPELGNHTWTSVTPRVSLVYKITDQSNVYFTYSEGFKSGAYNTVSFQPNPVAPETIDAYELGTKNTIAQNLRLNAAAFYYDYKNLQIPVILPQGTAQILENAASSQIYGVEVEGDWDITPQFNLVFGGTYLHATYVKFLSAGLNAPETDLRCRDIAHDPLFGTTGNCTLGGQNVSGNTMTNSPTFSANVAANYHVDTDMGHFEATLSALFSTKVYFDAGDRVTQPDYTLLNGSLAWSPPGHNNVQLKLWGRNLTNAAVIASTVSSSAADSLNYQPPRTYGVEASYKF